MQSDSAVRDAITAATNLIDQALETVARALSRLAQEGIVEHRGRSLAIPDRTRLERLLLSPADR